MNEISTGKVAVIGAGYVGASIAYALTIRGIAHEIVLIERPEAIEKCRAEINDIRHGIPHIGSSNIYNGNYADIKDCDIIIVAAGRNRRPDETRLEMASDNLKVISELANEIRKHYTRGVVIVVTNPVDIATRALAEHLELKNGTVFGTGCLLDSSRLISVIADYIGLSSDIISAYIIGEHGEGQIVCWSKVIIAGIPIANFCKMNGISFTEDTRSVMEQKVRLMGTDIIRGKGRTHYGIATCVCYLADNILNRRTTIASVSSVLNGEYGITGVALSLPCIISSNGIKHRIEDSLGNLELSKFAETAEKLKGYYEKYGNR